MKKQVILLCSLFILATNIWAQVEGLPTNPQPGKCYVRTITSEQFDTTERRIMVRPTYTTFTKLPAEYKTVEERVMVKAASRRYIAHPAEYRTIIDTIQVEAPYHEATVTSPKFVTKSENVEVRPKYARMEWETTAENCESKDPRDCMVLRYVEHPAEYRKVNMEALQTGASYTSEIKGGKYVTINRQIVAREAYCEAVDVPAEYITIAKLVLAKDEEIVRAEVPAQYATETVLVLKDPGGVEKWEEIDCALTDNNLLPVTYELGSARLTDEARSLIDSKLLKLMKDKPNIRVEIAAHTDSRGATDANLSLSQARSESVVNYLVGRGIQRSRLVAKGYGESKLKNRCADGVNCSEDEHAKNRRTEFRVLSN